MFCDVVGSTALSERLDPEDLREVVRGYQETCAEAIRRFDGHLAKYLGDGLLVHFGYPAAHEDDAERAVRSGLGIVEAIERLNPRLEDERGVELAVRVGIHTGLVVAGEMGAGEQREPLAIVGETPNIAARLQDLAEPNTVVISAATLRLIPGLFVCADLGRHTLKGLSESFAVYRVVQESGVRSRLDVATAAGLTPLVGRTQEVGVLLERWEQVQDGQGQVALLTGEAGVGKSRLVQVLRERLANDPHTWLECRCSPYTQNSTLYPVIDLVEQLLQLSRDDSPEEKLGKLERGLALAGLSLPEVLPLFAALLSVPVSDRYPPLGLSPERQRQKTLEALLEWLFALTAQQPVVLVVEDLHWTDPSSLELLSLLVDREPTARLFVLLVYRPEFRPPWPMHAHLTQVTITRLARRQVAVMAERVAGNKQLPEDVLQEIVAKTDGVPLFVEELTKMILESGVVREADGRYELTGSLPTLAVPATLHDSLIARLDRLSPAKEVAQLAAVLGREFSYELLHAVTRLDAAALEHALARLVDAELMYQRGVPPQASYTFKHALIQETAYQSLLKSRRHEFHTRVAQVLEERFPERVEAEPEEIARHCEGAGLLTQAVAYYQRAGERATERSANAEAIGHLTKGIELLSALPETPERNAQELTLHIALGAPLVAAKGYANLEVERVYGQARELCQRIGETPQLFPALWGLWRFYLNRGELGAAYQLGEQLLDLGKRARDSSPLLLAHGALGLPLYWQGHPSRALGHLEQAVTLYDPSEHRSLAYVTGEDPSVPIGSHLAWSLWSLGYPDRALHRSNETLDLAREGAHPFSLAFALFCSAGLHQMRRERGQAAKRGEEAVELGTELGFPMCQGWGLVLRGWARADPRTGDPDLEDIQSGLAQLGSTGMELSGPYALGILGEACWNCGRVEDALGALDAAFALSERTHQAQWDAQLYRLKGEIFLAMDDHGEEEAQQLLQRALEIARSQEAKSLELRAATSLARLWQRQGKREEARDLLAPIYGWFTEGFDTRDLKEAKALLEELG
jgi:TOMM system kinase/cyclase fusion protein